MTFPELRYKVKERISLAHMFIPRISYIIHSWAIFLVIDCNNLCSILSKYANLSLSLCLYAYYVSFLVTILHTMLRNSQDIRQGTWCGEKGGGFIQLWGIQAIRYYNDVYMCDYYCARRPCRESCLVTGESGINKGGGFLKDRLGFLDVVV